MLKAHQACIDLEKNVLRIQGREVKFLAEHELPDKARIMDLGEGVPPPQAGPSSAPDSQPPRTFPGSGNTLGGSSGGSGIRGHQPQPHTAPTRQNRYSEESIQTLISLGATREQAVNSLDAANGNLDVAASMLF
jgi:UBA/TS-N domain